MNKIIRIATVPESLDILLKDQLKYLNKYYDVVAVSSDGVALENVEKREKVRTLSVNMERKISPIKDFIALVKLYILFKKEAPYMIHSITPKAGLLSMLAGWLAGVPIRMHTFTGLIFPTRRGLMQKLLIQMDRLLCWASTNVYPEGQGVKNDLKDYKITSKPLKIIANGNINGIDITYFNVDQISEKEQEELKESLGINNDDFIFIFVGRIVGDKGINELMMAFEQLSQENQKVKLILVGNEEKELDPLKAESLHIIENNPNIITTGFQQDVRPYFAISNALVFPSYREGFPNVVMQAGAMKLPSIVTDINGCNEIIKEKINGTIIPVKDISVLYERMKNFVATSSEELHKMGESSRNEMISKYKREVVLEALLNEYKLLENV